MGGEWINIINYLVQEKNNPNTKALAVRHYNYRGTLCPLSLACWRIFRALPGSAQGAAVITGIPTEEICMVNGEYDRQIRATFGNRNAIDAHEAIDTFIDAIECVGSDLSEAEGSKRLRRTDRRRLHGLLFYDRPATRSKGS